MLMQKSRLFILSSCIQKSIIFISFSRKNDYKIRSPDKKNSNPIFTSTIDNKNHQMMYHFSLTTLNEAPMRLRNQ